jgi:hypothetical protein
MKLTHNLRGYDKHTDQLCYEQVIPERLLPSLKSMLAPTSSADPELMAVYELDAPKLHRIAAALEMPIDVNKYVYYLDASANWEDIKVAKRRLGV